MNKQAITFLSLFCLILVLSVYYIIIPPQDDQHVSTSSSTLSTIASMQQNLNDTRQSLINENNDIIASSKSKQSQINSALNQIAKTKETIAKEKELVTFIQSNGYKEAYVEIKDACIKIVVNKKQATSKDASRIIKLINEQMGTEYEIEVKFITE